MFFSFFFSFEFNWISTLFISKELYNDDNPGIEEAIVWYMIIFITCFYFWRQQTVVALSVKISDFSLLFSVRRTSWKCIPSSRGQIVAAVVAWLLRHVWLFMTPWTVSPLGSSVHGIFQVRILDRVAISYSSRSFPPKDCTCVSCIGWHVLYLCATQGA